MKNKNLAFQNETNIQGKGRGCKKAIPYRPMAHFCMTGP